MAEVIARYGAEKATAEVVVPGRILPSGHDVDVDVRLRSRTDGFELEEVNLAFETRCRTGEQYEEVVASRHVLVTDLVIDSGLTRTKTRTVTVPSVLPSAIGSIDTWARVLFETKEGAAEYAPLVQVPMRTPTRAVIRTMVDAGFAVRDANCIRDPSPRDCPFAQRIGFRSTTDASERDVRGVDVFLRHGVDETGLLVVLDRDGDDPGSTTHGNDLEIVVGNDEDEPVRDALNGLLDGLPGPQ